MNLGDVLGKVAPWLAAAASGPAGIAAVALKTLGEAFNLHGAGVDDIVAAVAGATPEQLQRIKDSEHDFQVRMTELGFKNVTDLERIAADDRDSARRNNVAGGTHWPLFWLSMLLLSISLGANMTVLFAGYPSQVPDLVIGRVLGLLDAVTMTVLAYWYGTTAQSDRKTGLLAQAPSVNGGK